MSLFTYKVSLSGGAEKTGKITAKSELEARARVAKQMSIVEWLYITESPKKPTAKISAPILPAVKKIVAKQPVKSVSEPQVKRPLTKLDKLLFLQSSKCFFCGRTVTKDEASVEHLVARSKGGSNADENVVACCKTTNQTFGSMNIKEKLRIILDKAGDFVCPK